MKMEAPRYKTVRVIAPMGIPYALGAEIRTIAGWPKPGDVEPVNEAARRIMYYNGPARDGGMYSVPHNPLLNKTFLPAAPVVVDDVIAGMPLYTVSENRSVDVHPRGSVRCVAGKPFAFLGWPADYLAPANEPAEKVTAYFAANKDNPELLLSPWCMYEQTVVLPDLPETRRSKEAQARVEGHYRALDADFARQQEAKRREEMVLGSRSWDGL